MRGGSGDIVALRAPFVDGLACSELRYLHCQACGSAQHLLRHACTRCGGNELSWRVACGEGTVHAVTEVARAPTQAYRARVPYTLVLVDLLEGPRVMGHGWAGATVGDAVRVHFESIDGTPLLRFAPASA